MLAATYALADFPLEKLPHDSRQRNSAAFRDAVRRHVGLEFAARGATVIVEVDATHASVHAFDDPAQALAHLMPLLEQRQLVPAIEHLELLVKVHPEHAQLLYNLGVAYSETAQYDEAILRLKRCVQHAPKAVHAWVALGTAYERRQQYGQARAASERAHALDPADPYAARNLGALRLRAGRTQEALELLRQAHRKLPGDGRCAYGLAAALLELDTPAADEEADGLLSRYLEQFPAGEHAENVREMRTKLAHKSLRRNAPAGVRMDVVFYMLNGLELFAKNGKAWRDRTCYEIAVLGRSGLDINNPDKTYRLRQMEGEFSGLQLLALMYAGFHQIDPQLNVGVDFAAEYEAAASLQRLRHDNPKAPARDA